MTKRQRKKLLGIVIALIISLLGYGLNQQNPDVSEVLGSNSPGLYRVTQVFDGDTIEVDMNGNREKIRLIGVDTPETQDPRKNVQCFGQAASNFTKQQLKDASVRLEADPQSQNRDRYNRLLRYVYHSDGRLIQAEIIRQGYGFAYTSFPFSKSEDFKRLEQEARENNRGLWGDCQINSKGNSRSTNDNP